MRGGASAGRCWPTPAFCGRPGYETFGAAIAFEAGDANGDNFAHIIGQRMAEVFAADGLKAEEVGVSFDPEDVTYPAPEDSHSNRRKR